MLKHLNLDEMIGLSDPWVNETAGRALFASIPEIAPLHPQVVELHGEMVDAQPAQSARSAALQQLIEQADAVDLLHDALVRAVHSGLQTDRLGSLARPEPDLARAERAEEIRNKLFPGGLAIVNASLVAESGNTKRVAALLEREPEIEAFLASIPVHEGTLLDLIRRWTAAGKKLGRLEQQRAALLSKESNAPRDPSTLSRLRVDWIRLVSLVLDILEASRADAEAIDRLRGPVLEASERAGKRYDLPAAAASAESDDDDETDATEGASTGADDAEDA